MKKAFLFDMDGVLADTETEWDRMGYDDLLKAHFGEDLFAKVKISSGTSIKGIFDQFVSVGWSGDYDSFFARNVEMGNKIYSSIAIAPGTQDLIDYLVGQNFVVGVVSSSPMEWIKMLTSRLPNHDKISLFISVNNHKTLKPKPAPDPYLYAMEQLKVLPSNTLILEDSQKGVIAGKSSGARVICFSQFNRGHHWQTTPPDADYYTSSMTEVQEIVAKIDLK